MKKKYPLGYLLAGVIILVAIGAFWLIFRSQIEGVDPEIQIRGLGDSIGMNQALEVTVTDRRAGIRKVDISLLQDGTTHSILSKEIPGGGTTELTLAVTIQPQQLKLKEQEAQLVISAVDHSWRKNTALVNRPVVIDTTPPRISLLTPTNYLNPGGTGTISYKTSEPPAVHGVLVGEAFSTGHPVHPDKIDMMVAYFPVPREAKQGVTKIMIMAEDKGGNITRISLPHLIRDKKFTHDRMALSENFLQAKMPEFEARFSELKGKTPLEIFVHINDRMREDNYRQIREITGKTSLKQHWEGTFLRMQNASPMAGFGEQRTYLYGGKPVGESVHLGVDLASTTNASIQAANNGIVAFTGYLGIYGNTVIIDHGFGLFSLYSHLNDISAKNEQQVKKGDIIGTSGVSGLAGGDHLHYSIIAGGQFVEPKEWWDPKWIADNVTNKLAGAAQ